MLVLYQRRSKTDSFFGGKGGLFLKQKVKMSRALLLLVVLACLCVGGLAQFNHTLRWDKATNTYNVTADPTWGEFVCEAVYVPTYEASGWDILTVSPAKALLEEPSTQGRAYFAAGYIEGYLTHQRIHDNWLNTIEPVNSTLTTEILKWIDEHYTFMSKMMDSRPSGVSEAMARQIINQLEQMKGMGAGYRAAHTAAGESLTDRDIFMMNFQHEVSDVAEAVMPHLAQMYKRFPNLAEEFHIHKEMSCSAIIKVTDKDLFVSHNTWTGYNTMLRLYKTYKFQVAVSFSSYGGLIESKDDWYVTSNGLVAQETTNPQNNATLSRLYVVPKTISEFMRVLMANYLSNTAPQWADIFDTLNSGTYNNQWMCVDMKLFTPGKEIVSDTLWVAEQLPGSVTMGDQSKILREQKYWASYNRPFYQKVRELSGVAALEGKYGSYYSYTNYSRAQIFQRDHSKVTNLETLKTLMRYNDYEHDEYSLIPYCKGATGDVCNPKYGPSLSIAARHDLAAPGDKTNYGELYTLFTPACRGATDAKITSWSMLQNKTLTGVIIAGPTTDKQPPFEWSAAVCNGEASHHHGHVARFSFDWQTIEVPAQSIPVKDESKDSHTAIIVIFSIIGVIALGIAGFMVARKTCFPAASEAAYKAV